MFTGIVEEVGTATLVGEGRLSFASRHALQELAIGDSISVNGACLTITSIEEEVFSVDVMPETLRRTNLVDLKVGDPVNLEKPLTLSSRLGGHIMQGHVDGRGRVLSVTPEGEAMIMEIEAPTDLMRYIVAKGFIGVDGASLTVMDRREETFTVSLVSYTWENTTLRERNPNDWVNLEVDILAKYVEQLIKGDNSGVSLYSLAQQGES